ncbi:hypothetical protein UFOVP1336_12 [uncultured Caudovirales phage]|uniref:Uncharacterized protein n=1 Tax=uncultured Caudovirales phage TaxID=2100421 RepID=A0A6J5RP01_9CAUD|nr:hypothetical protein UFOVP1336_12 [uncultured Caudovirales phage]
MGAFKDQVIQELNRETESEKCVRCGGVNLTASVACNGCITWSVETTGKVDFETIKNSTTEVNK